uniref:Ring finger protein 11b n=1 Tax=Cyprinus carpio carpio TaxID=630221 RepID=A0A9J7XPN2_CYPCA
MGNCLKSPTSDDISLLHESQSDRASFGDANDPDQEPPPPYQEQIHVPVYHPTPSQARLATQLTEEEQVRIAQRIGLIQHLPKGVYDPGSDGTEKKIRECVICMMDFVYGDPIRFLPCMHIYHLDCIDDWLMRARFISAEAAVEQNKWHCTCTSRERRKKSFVMNFAL